MSRIAQLDTNIRYLTVREVAQHYRVSRDTVVRWIKAGRLSADNIGTKEHPRYRVRDINIGKMVVETTKQVTEEVIEFIK